MSRRHRRRHRHHENNGGFPRPPQKTIRCRQKSRRRVNTEVHDAVWSLGSDDRTAKLSDREFNGQVAKEIGYMFKLSGSHFKRACDSLVALWHELF